MLSYLFLIFTCTSRFSLHCLMCMGHLQTREIWSLSNAALPSRNFATCLSQRFILMVLPFVAAIASINMCLCWWSIRQSAPLPSLSSYSQSLAGSNSAARTWSDSNVAATSSSTSTPLGFGDRTGDRTAIPVTPNLVREAKQLQPCHDYHYYYASVHLNVTTADLQNKDNIIRRSDNGRAC